MRTPKGYRLHQNPRRSSGGGTPAWVIPAVVVGGGLIAYLVLSKPSNPSLTAKQQAQVAAANPWANIIGGAASALTKLTSPGAPTATAKPAAAPASDDPLKNAVFSLNGYSF